MLKEAAALRGVDTAPQACLQATVDRMHGAQHAWWIDECMVGKCMVDTRNITHVKFDGRCCRLGVIGINLFASRSEIILQQNVKMCTFL